MRNIHRAGPDNAIFPDGFRAPTNASNHEKPKCTFFFFRFVSLDITQRSDCKLMKFSVEEKKNFQTTNKEKKIVFFGEL